jgi:hypothetical protein
MRKENELVHGEKLHLGKINKFLKEYIHHANSVDDITLAVYYKGNFN